MLWFSFVLVSTAMMVDSKPATADVAEAGAVLKQRSVNVGFILDAFTGIPLEDAKIAIRLIFEKRFKEWYPEYAMNVIIFQDINSAVKAIKNHRITSIATTALDYLETKDELNLEPVRIAEFGHSAKSRFMLLVRKDGAPSLDMLRNKKLVIEQGGHGRVGAMWLDTLLLERSFPESTGFFRSVDIIEKDSQAVLKVFFEKSDACLVQENTFNLMKELNPQIGVKLHPLFVSPEYLMAVYAVVQGIDEHTRNMVTSFTDGFSDDPQGMKIMSLFRSKGVSEFTPEHIQTLENLYKTYLSLKKNGNARGHGKSR